MSLGDHGRQQVWKAAALRPPQKLLRNALLVSGYATLDALDLHAARSVAPFEPPPEAMAIVLGMPFSREQQSKQARSGGG